MNLATLEHYLHTVCVIREAKVDEGERAGSKQLLKLLGSESRAINAPSLASSFALTSTEAKLH